MAARIPIRRFLADETKHHTYVRPAGRKKMDIPPATWSKPVGKSTSSFPASDPPGDYENYERPAGKRPRVGCPAGLLSKLSGREEVGQVGFARSISASVLRDCSVHRSIGGYAMAEKTLDTCSTIRSRTSTTPNATS